MYLEVMHRKYEHINDIFRSHASWRYRQYDGQKKQDKKTNIYRWNTTPKTKDWAIELPSQVLLNSPLRCYWTPPSGVTELPSQVFLNSPLRCYWIFSWSCSTSGIRLRVSLKRHEHREFFFIFYFLVNFHFFLQTTHSSHHMHRTRQTYYKCK